VSKLKDAQPIIADRLMAEPSREALWVWPCQWVAEHGVALKLWRKGLLERN